MDLRVRWPANSRNSYISLYALLRCTPDFCPLDCRLVGAQDQKLGVVFQGLRVLLFRLLRPGVRRVRLHSLDDKVGRLIHIEGLGKFNGVQVDPAKQYTLQLTPHSTI